MPNTADLEGHVNTFVTLAGTVFAAGITVAIGRIGWRVAKRYFFSGAS